MRRLNYIVYCDEKVIYDASSEALALIDPVLILEDNAPGSFSFSIAKTHPFYDNLKVLKSTIKIEKDAEILFEGRITEATADFYGTQQIYCSGALSYLTDSVQGFHNYNGVTIRNFLENLVAFHNSQVGENRQFAVGTVTVTDSNNAIYKRTNYDDTLTCINEKLLKSFGGHIRVRYDYSTGTRYIDYLADWVDVCTQKIEFGKNLLDFSQTIDLSDLCTVVIPLGAKPDNSDERLTIKSVNNGSDYLTASQAAIDLYGRVSKVVIWDDVTVAANLKTKGQNYLQETQYENLVLECTAVDLNKMDVQIERLKILQEVWVYSSPHGLDKKFPITKLTLNFSYPEKDTVTLGSKQQRSFTSSSVGANTEIVEKINSMPTKYQILEDAKNNATAILNAATHGYVVTEPNEILVMNTADKNTATKLWRWNINGLGYSSNGYNGPYTTAITMNGQIVADFITTGTLSANRVRTGRLEDIYGTNYFDLSTGKLHCVDADLSGRFESGANDDFTRIENGRISTYYQNIQIGGLTNSRNSSNLSNFELIYCTDSADIKGVQIGVLNSGGAVRDLVTFGKQENYFSLGLRTAINLITGYNADGSYNTKGVSLNHRYKDSNLYGRELSVQMELGVAKVNDGGVQAPAPYLGTYSFHNNNERYSLATLYVRPVINNPEYLIGLSGERNGSFSTVLYIGSGKMSFAGAVNASSFNASSTEDIKENIAECSSLSDILKSATVYQYNLIQEQESSPQGEQEEDIPTDSSEEFSVDESLIFDPTIIESETVENQGEIEPKNHIGLIINENLPEILLSDDGKHIDLYTMLSINWKVTQEILSRLEALEGSNQNE